MRRVGLKDVAARAGVSINTVSRAIRAPQTVRPELRRQIEALLDELDYVPNRLAGGLAGASTEVVGVILTSLFYSEYAAMIDALQGGLARAGLSVMIGNSHYDLDQELALVRTMLSWRPAAMALVGTDHHPRVQELLATAAIPVVEIWEAAEDRIDSAVGMDHGAIGRMQARHLVDLGCRRIAFIGCVRRHDYRAQRRRDGCLEVLADGGLKPVAVTAPDGGSADLGEALLGRLLDAHPRHRRHRLQQRRHRDGRAQGPGQNRPPGAGRHRRHRLRRQRGLGLPHADPLDHPPAPRRHRHRCGRDHPRPDRGRAAAKPHLRGRAGRTGQHGAQTTGGKGRWLTTARTSS
jgi:DNA-binding LacI/PurR family transcriptional regulator